MGAVTLSVDLIGVAFRDAPPSDSISECGGWLASSKKWWALKHSISLFLPVDTSKSNAVLSLFVPVGSEKQVWNCELVLSNKRQTLSPCVPLNNEIDLVAKDW